MTTHPAWMSAYQFVRLVFKKFLEVRILQTAGSLTYTTLLSLVPMVTVVLTMLRQFAPFAKFGDELRLFLLQNLLPERAGKMITAYALQFSQKASSLTVVGTVFLVLTAVMLFQTIDHTLNGIWNVRRPRVWYVRLPVYWLALTIGPVMFAVSVAATAELINVSHDLVEAQSNWLQSALSRLLTTALLASLFGFMFHAIPNRRLVLWHSIVGGVVAAIGVAISQRLFGIYLSKLPNFALIYGTFSVLPIFLIWVYLSWLMLLLGATIAAVLPDFLNRRRQLPDTGTGRMVAAVRLAQAIIAAQRGGKPAALFALAQQSHQSMAMAEEMLEKMRSAGWVVRTDDGLWVLCLAAENLRLGALLGLLQVGLDLERTHANCDYVAEDIRLAKYLAAHMATQMTLPVEELRLAGSEGA